MDSRVTVAWVRRWTPPQWPGYDVGPPFTWVCPRDLTSNIWILGLQWPGGMLVEPDPEISGSAESDMDEERDDPEIILEDILPVEHLDFLELENIV
ncbi:hypothetical protein QE152_g35250 [Popillia japonica]|uniref:Uncharacterized protein n=1 Tax=Popillia japonica TaxID=7064 RepID=A0AAW1IFK7_POPJA